MTEDRRLLPEGWKPRPGAHVRLLPNPKAAPDEPPPPVGVWWVVDRAPFPRCWWVQPYDDEAWAWANASEVNRRATRSMALPYTRLTPAATARRG